MRVLVTGHTGFKGAWLSLALAAQGHDVHGIALDPEPGSLYSRADVSSAIASDRRLDIRDAARTAEAIAAIQPELAFHLAAQPLVRRSYAEPRITVETNVMGTFNVIESLAREGCRAAVVVTTDKVYRNVGRLDGYREDDALGGHDPYSASKAAADLIALSWCASFPGMSIAVARAGNVIGGGDVSADRLLPDLLRAFAAGEPAQVRNPDAVRPWQHVLDCLAGYLRLADALIEGRGEGPWNFGPLPDSCRTVGEAADEAVRCWGDGASWEHAEEAGAPHEASLLTLDSRKARAELGWSDRLPFAEAIDWTIRWQRAVEQGGDAGEITRAQLEGFAELEART